MTVKGTTALVGVAGGSGTTRLAIEFGATLARAGHDVAVLDAAFGTEGLARHVSGRIDPDITKLLADDERALEDGLLDHSVDLPGRLALCPAHGPFERLARAKTAGAAERFGDLVETAGREFDHVLVDTPPIATNQAVAATTATERVACVAPATARGVDALQRTRGRLADVGASVDAVIANRAPDRHPVEAADAAVPASSATAVRNVPASAPDPDTEFAPAVARAAEAALDVSFDLPFPEEGTLDVDPEEYLPDVLS